MLPGIVPDHTLPKFSQYSPEIELPKQPPSFLIGFFQIEKFSSPTKSNKGQIVNFSTKYTGAIAHHKHYYRLIKKGQCNRNFTAFRTAHNQFKRILENGKSNYTQAVKKKK